MKKILVLIIFVVAGYFGYIYFFKNNDNPIIKPKYIYEDILNNTSEKSFFVNRFTIYGKYLNLEGELPTDNGIYRIVLKNNDIEIPIETLVKEENISNSKFYTSEYINDGINLEKLAVGDYIVLLKELNNNTYYTLLNNTEYHDNTYWTMTKDRKNNLITFPELTYKDKKYWTINVKEEKLPDDFYDIIIDPGHGGVDTGAGNGRYNESTFTLDYAKTLYDVLKEEGLKVKLTRDKDINIDHYGEGSRTGIPYETKAKLMLSIHLNSSNSSSQNGVEIYKAYGDNNTFAKLLADNIVTEAKTSYSINPQHKVLNGVYMRVYSKTDINNLAKEAKRDGYEPYVLGDDETYYYFIRETGGIMTKAFSDGRNPKFKENPYRNYNQAVEAYLCELGYISNNNEIKNIINQKDGYINALKLSVLSYVNN